MTTIEQAVELWYQIAQQLNTIIKEDGAIDKDDKRIWQGFLHQWRNEEWMLLIEAICLLYQQHGELFKPYHKHAMEDTIIAMTRGIQHPRIMDTKPNKRRAWQMIMCLREVWNRACDEVIEPTTSKPRPANQFKELFNLASYAGRQ